MASARVLVGQIFRPIENITAAVNALTEKDGDLTARLPTDDNNEISDLAATGLRQWRARLGGCSPAYRGSLE